MKGGAKPPAATQLTAPVRTQDERVQTAGASERARARKRASAANTRLSTEGGFTRGQSGGATAITLG